MFQMPEKECRSITKTSKMNNCSSMFVHVFKDNFDLRWKRVATWLNSSMYQFDILELQPHSDIKSITVYGLNASITHSQTSIPFPSPSASASSSSSSRHFPFHQKWHTQKSNNNNNQIDESISPIIPPTRQLSFFFKSSQEEVPFIIDGTTNTHQKFINPFAKNQTTVMWPYQSYKPISWDKYYAHDIQDKHVSITSGLAAGITIGVFFAVFLLTFGCRLYSQRSDARNRSQNSSSRRRLSVSDLLGWSTTPTPCQPPPPYEVAIQMPAPCSTSTLSTLVSTPCDPPAPTYEDSCRHGSPQLGFPSSIYHQPQRLNPEIQRV